MKLTRAEARVLKRMLDDIAADPGARVVDILTEADLVLVDQLRERLKQDLSKKPTA